MATQYLVEPRQSSHRKRLHVPTKRVGSQEASLVQPEVREKGSMQEASRKQKISRASLSISLSLDSADLREDMAKVTMLSLEELLLAPSRL